MCPNGQGYIKLYRSLLFWEWYDDINVSRLFIHLLLKANYTVNKWQGLEIMRSELVTSVDQLSSATQLTKQQTRTALKKLKSTNEITIRSTNKFTIIRVQNYEKYQEEPKSVECMDNKQITNKQQTNNIPITTLKESKKLRKKEEERKNTKKEKWVCAQKILDQFNLRTNSSYRSKSNLVPILARLDEGYTEEELLIVCDFKAWEASKFDGFPDSDNPVGFPADHLNPGTLYRPSNFEKYLNNARKRMVAK